MTMVDIRARHKIKQEATAGNRITMVDRKMKPKDRVLEKNDLLILTLIISTTLNVASILYTPNAEETPNMALQREVEYWKLRASTTNSASNRALSSGISGHVSKAKAKTSLTSHKRPTAAWTEKDGTKKVYLQSIYDKFSENHFVRPNRGLCGNPNIETRKNLTSSIEFVGCCGLGHRLARMAAAAHVATDFESPLFGYWGCCDDVTPVFSHLFGTKPLVLGPIFERENNKELDHHLQFISETPGFSLVKSLRKNKCPVRDEKVDSDYKFYSSLRSQYRKKEDVDDFVRENFTNRTAIGIHIRAGNGETGDFVKKGRAISDAQLFIDSLANSVLEMVDEKLKGKNPPILFLATDTPSYVTSLRSKLADKIPVIDMPQVRMAPGKGVFFGEHGDVLKHGSTCLDGWDGAVQDMILLSHADILLIPLASSFTQTMPASLIMGRPDRIPSPFCEWEGFNVEEPESKPSWKCHDSVQDWSCDSSETSLILMDANLDQRNIL